jgi:adenine-specific DNA-methyltransferase
MVDIDSVFSCALEPVSGLSYGNSSSANRLVEGETVKVLATLGPELTGRVRCIYADPPYNTAERWTHFDDRVNHDLWLATMAEILRASWPCLSEDGSLWVSIDDGSMHYLKVLADDILGRSSFVTTVVWQHRTTRENRRTFSNNHEYLLVYAKDPRVFRRRRNRITAPPQVAARYKNPDNDPRGPWQSVSANVQAGHATNSQFYELTAPNGTRHVPPNGRCWAYTKDRLHELIAAGEVWFGKDGNGVPRIKRYLAGATLGVTPETVWGPDLAGTTMSAKHQLLSMFPDEPVFDTPKPEALIRQILTIATDPGDLVLDGFLGSGTTAAVAHKMGRSWLGIERGRHAVTHCAERMRKVVDGEPGGISAEVGWSGGGGFAFLRERANSALAA